MPWEPCLAKRPIQKFSGIRPRSCVHPFCYGRFLLNISGSSSAASKHESRPDASPTNAALQSGVPAQQRRANKGQQGTCSIRLERQWDAKLAATSPNYVPRAPCHGPVPPVCHAKFLVARRKAAGGETPQLYPRHTQAQKQPWDRQRSQHTRACKCQLE